MTFNWFKIFNKDEFLATELASKTYTLNLEGIGLKQVLVTMGNQIGVTLDGVFLTLGESDKNPFIFDGMAIYINESNDVFWGYEINED